ncbi:hypothetical protein JOB18_045129 [Solea senegalensis]|uniref:Uncharacterized protein n=1 Tax=Solea senegalensis TaxID=28829 RepID=A0AAV6QSY0_SOLSE|nr:hypothetical protein JOB18_045129 [Solea senegalensis]
MASQNCLPVFGSSRADWPVGRNDVRRSAPAGEVVKYGFSVRERHTELETHRNTHTHTQEQSRTESGRL